MTRSLPRPWWWFLFMFNLAIMIFSIIWFILGRGPVLAPLLGLANTCIIAAQLFRRAILLLFGLAFAILTIGIVIAII